MILWSLAGQPDSEVARLADAKGPQDPGISEQLFACTGSWRPSLGWRSSLFRLEAIAIGLEAIASRLEAIATRWRPSLLETKKKTSLSGAKATF